MNLIELYKSLNITETQNDKVFNAVLIPDKKNLRIAKNFECFPVLLITILVKNNNLVNFKNYNLKYLKIENNIECKVIDREKSIIQNFTAITFLSQDKNLQEYFLLICETLIKKLSNQPSEYEINQVLAKFIEIFSSLTDAPKKTIQGLWAELFIIANSKDSNTLLQYWHNNPTEKFDFNSGLEKIEVKSNSNFERVHTFSSEQLNPEEGTEAIIASVFIRHNSNGLSIRDLSELITKKLNDNSLKEKLSINIIETLGSSLEISLNLKFDYSIAKDSLRFYSTRDIKKIEKANIPELVTEVRFKSNLNNIQSLDLLEITNHGELFNSL